MLVTDIKEDKVFFNDPGGPTYSPEENRKVSLDVFLQAWAGEDGRGGTTIVVKKHSTLEVEHP